MMAYFETLVDLLNSQPAQQCVVRREFLDTLAGDPDDAAIQLGIASQRDVKPARDIVEIPEKNLALRDAVFVFAPKKESA